MIEIGLALWIVIIGAVAMLPVTGTPDTKGAFAVVIVPSGYALYVLAALILTVFDQFSSLGALALASVIAGAVAIGWLANTARRQSVSLHRFAASLAIVSAIVAVIASASQLIHFTRMTPDSMTYLTAAGGLERTGGLEGMAPVAVLKRLLVIPSLHAPGALTGRGYVASAMPIVGTAGLALTGWLAAQALRAVDTPRRWKIWILGSAAAFLLTTNRVVFNVTYLHTHMVFATFLILGVGMAWLAVHRGRWAFLLPAMLGFAALPMLRAEAVLVGIIFLLPLVTEERLPVGGKWAISGAFAATTLLWFGAAVPPHVGSGDLGLTGPVWGSVAGAMALLGLAAAAHVTAFRPLLRHMPAVALALLTLYVGVSALRDPTVFEESLAATAANLAVVGRWGMFWIITIPLVVVAILAIEVPLQRLFAYPIVTYWVAIVAFVYLREGGYRAAPGDSGNRMMMHITFATMVYLVMAAGRAAAAADEAEQPRPQPASVLASTP